MSKFFLQMNLSVDFETEEEAIAFAKSELLGIYRSHRLEGAAFTLVREGDRGSKNILRPRIEGRFGNHLVNKKITLDELFPGDSGSVSEDSELPVCGRNDAEMFAEE